MLEAGPAVSSGDSRATQSDRARHASPELDSKTERGFKHWMELYDRLPIGYAIVSMDGRIAHANLTLATWLEMERDALRGEALHRFLPPFESGRLAAHFEICPNARKTITLETMLRAPDGGTVPVLFSSHAASGPDGRKFVHTAITHLGQLRQTEEAVTELEREETVLIELLSHDLRSPLITIHNYTQILLEEPEGTLRSEARVMLERMERASRRMDTTLQQLLTYANLRRDQPRLEPVDTEEIVSGVVAERRQDVARRHAVVAIIRPMPPVRACPRLLAQALSNLLANALEFSARDLPPRITVSCEEQERSVLLKVADEGVGIEPRHQERIFQAGERVHGRSNCPGAGLGLAIVRRAVERMHGRVWVESNDGHGSCFQIMLQRV